MCLPGDARTRTTERTRIPTTSSIRSGDTGDDGSKFQATVTNERLQQISPKKAGDLRAVTEFAYEQVARIEKRVKEQEEMERQCDASKRTLLAEVKLMAAEIESS